MWSLQAQLASMSQFLLAVVDVIALKASGCAADASARQGRAFSG